MSVPRIEVTRSRRGIPCITESGGAMTNTHTDIVCVANPEGCPKRPLKVFRSGHLSCAEHAVIPIEIGDVVGFLPYGKRDDTIDDVMLYRVKGFKTEEESEILELEEMQFPYEEKFSPLVEAVFRKSRIYHCRCAVFVDEKEVTF